MTIIGANVLSLMLNTSDPEKLLEMLMSLTDNFSLDGVLSLIQTVYLLVLALELKLVIAALFASAIGLMIGLTLRFIPKVGEALYGIGLRIAIFGVSGYMIVMLVIAIVVGSGRLIAGDSAMARGFTNVVAIVAATIVLWNSLRVLKDRIGAVANGIINGFNNATGRSGEKPEPSSGDGTSQDSAEAADQIRGTRHTNRTRQSETGDSNTTKPSSPSSGSTPVQRATTAGGEQLPHTPPRAASTAVRFATDAANKAPDPRVQAAATAVQVTQGVQGMQDRTSSTKESGQPYVSVGSTNTPTPTSHTTPGQTPSHRRGGAIFSRETPPTEAQVTAETYQRDYGNPPAPEPPAVNRHRHTERSGDG